MVIPGDNDLPKETIKIGLKNMNKADLVMLFLLIQITDQK